MKLCGKCRIVIVVALALLITTSCAFDSKHKSERSERDSGRRQVNYDQTVAEIWRAAAVYHEVAEDNIALVERLLEKLGDGSTVPGKDGQSQLHDSLDVYLEQFACRLRAESAKTPEKYCYWIAWCISKGIRRTPPSQDKAAAIHASYRDFARRVILDANSRLLEGKGVQYYARNVETIESCSKQAEELFESCYSNLHDDFLFPAFRDPMSEDLKIFCMERVRNTFSVPAIAGTKGIEHYFRDICTFSTYWMTLKTIWGEYHRTEEWGYMDASASTPSTAPGKWPIDVRFEPDHEFNRLKAEEEKAKGS